LRVTRISARRRLNSKCSRLQLKLFDLLDNVVGNVITRAGCWARTKRKIIDAEKCAPQIAHETVERIRALPAIECKARDAAADDRLKQRLS
jgi:hypothetical protein